jgi:surface protein
MILSISSRIRVLLLWFLLGASTTAGREYYEPSHLRRQERNAVHSPLTRVGATRSLSPINCTSTDTSVPITQDNIYDAVRESLDNRDIACSIYGPIDPSLNTTSVTNMTKLFSGAGDFQGNISNWDVSNVVNMERMFMGWNIPFDMDLSA